MLKIQLMIWDQDLFNGHNGRDGVSKILSLTIVAQPFIQLQIHENIWWRHHG